MGPHQGSACVIHIDHEVKQMIASAKQGDYQACVATLSSLPPFLSAFVMMEFLSQHNTKAFKQAMKLRLNGWERAEQ